MDEHTSTKSTKHMMIDKNDGGGKEDDAREK